MATILFHVPTGAAFTWDIKLSTLPLIPGFSKKKATMYLFVKHANLLKTGFQPALQIKPYGQGVEEFLKNADQRKNTTKYKPETANKHQGCTTRGNQLAIERVHERADHPETQPSPSTRRKPPD